MKKKVHIIINNPGFLLSGILGTVGALYFIATYNPATDISKGLSLKMCYGALVLSVSYLLVFLIRSLPSKTRAEKQEDVQ